MDFGMPTLVECPDLEACCALGKELGLQFVEFNMSFPQYQLESVTAATLRRLRERYGLYFTVHMDEQMNPFDFNRRIAEAYTEEMLDVIALAREAGIPRLNLHLMRGVYVTLPGKRIYLYDVYRDEYLKNVRAFAERCEKALDGSDTLICMENVDEGLDGFHRAAARRLFEYPHFALTLDVGHARMTGDKDIPFYDEHEDRLRHMHLHNAAAGPHMPLDEGSIDIQACLRRAERSGSTVVVEVKTIEGLRRSCEWLRAQDRL